MKIFLSIPILGKPELRHIYSVYQSVLSCPQHKVRIYFNENDSLISRIRNVHISSFLNDYPDCDYFMSLDSDLEILNSYPNNNIFEKLLSHNLDFVGGLYALKKQGESRCSSIPIDCIVPQFDSGIKEMRWLSSGCWCIKRSAVEKMVAAYPELMYDGDDNVIGKKIYALYLPMLYDLKEGDFPNTTLPFKKYLSEDWSFAERWKKIGGKIYADTSIALKHIGKADYTVWDFTVTKKTRTTLPPPGFDLDPKIMEELEKHNG